ncbi:uncharacterized protein TNCV_1003901 [Trichonephila clavipes]|nr:uncharacterized protein TNCV_1003901 [Trichonephila clavipes]
MKAKRLNWAKQWHDKDVDLWRLVCFSDVKAHLKFCRTKLSLCVVMEKSFILVKHSTKIMIWSVISGKGTGGLYVVKGMMQQDQ